MKRGLFIVIVLLGRFLFGNAEAQNIRQGYEHLLSPVRQYIVYQTKSNIIIDGNADESSWDKAKWTQTFVDIEDYKKPAPLYRTRAKMLWNAKYLYVFAEIEEPQIWAYYDTHDQIVFHENDFEIFIDPNRDGYHYFEFEVNAQNTLFDLLLPKPYRNGGKAVIEWDAKGFKSAVSIDGTINNPTDIDKKWNVEIAIPFEALKETNRHAIPKDGETWKLDFSRVNWQTVVKNGRYEKKKDASTGRPISEFNWVWSPPGIINMHFPERWGLLQFSSAEVGKKTVSFCLPEDELYKPWLWLVYYKQQNFRNKNGTFATTFHSIEMSDSVTTKNGETVQLKMNADKTHFNVWLVTTKGIKISLNESGLIQKKERE